MLDAHVYANVCVHVYVHPGQYVCQYIYMCFVCSYVFVNVCAFIYVFLCVCICAYFVHVWVFVYVVCVPTCLCVCVYVPTNCYAYYCVFIKGYELWLW